MGCTAPYAPSLRSTKFIHQSIPLSELSKNMQLFFAGRASDASYSASKCENRNYNLGRNFVHIGARAMISMAFNPAHRDASESYIIYPKKYRLSLIFIVHPEIYPLSPKLILCSVYSVLSQKMPFIPKISFILKIYR